MEVKDILMNKRSFNRGKKCRAFRKRIGYDHALLAVLNIIQ